MTSSALSALGIQTLNRLGDRLVGWESTETMTSQTWIADYIFRKFGIRKRHIAAPHETAADLGYLAAERLFEELRLVLCQTQNFGLAQPG